MKIKDLIKQLKAYNPNDEIHLSIDSEGNAIKKIWQVTSYDNGDLIEDEDGDTLIHGKRYKWVVKEKLLVIWPTDEVVCD